MTCTMFSPATLFDVASLTTFTLTTFPDVHTQISKLKLLKENNTHPEQLYISHIKDLFLLFFFSISNSTIDVSATGTSSVL